MNKENSTDYRSRIQIILLIIQLISYIIFISSYFMNWGYLINECTLPIFPDPFTGLDIDLGNIFMLFFSIEFLLLYLVNFIYLYLARIRKIFHKFIWLINTLMIFLCPILFITTLTSISDYSFYPCCVYLKLEFGFYLWLYSFIIYVGLLLLFYIKIINYPNKSNL